MISSASALIGSSLQPLQCGFEQLGLWTFGVNLSFLSTGSLHSQQCVSSRMTRALILSRVCPLVLRGLILLPRRSTATLSPPYCCPCYVMGWAYVGVVLSVTPVASINQGACVQHPGLLHGGGVRLPGPRSVRSAGGPALRIPVDTALPFAGCDGNSPDSHLWLAQGYRQE